MKTGFSVTYGIITEESAKVGDYAETGYLAENVSFRNAITEFGEIGPVEADICPCSIDNPPRWFSSYSESPDYHTGEYENRGFHMPDTLTPSTRMRIARLLGCYGIK